MKRIIIWSLIIVFALSVAFIGTGCKTSTTATTAAAETTAATTAAETTVAETKAAETTAAETKSAELVDMTWVSPRGYLEIMGDYELWVAKEMGYFEANGINLIMEGGPNDAFATIKLVDQGKADVGFPSPGVLCTGVDTGINVIGLFEMVLHQVFDFAVRPDSNINSFKDLEGKIISVWDQGAKVVIDPILFEQGIDPNAVTLVVGGMQWGQTVWAGKADAAISWIDNEVQWKAQGMDFKMLRGADYSKHPSNAFAVSKNDLKDPEKRELLTRFMRATAMGIHFTRFNPPAAAQITYNQFPALKEQMTPEIALQSFKGLHKEYSFGERLGNGYGWFDMDSWKSYLEAVYQLGQTTKQLLPEDVVTNELLKEINDFDRAKVQQDAENFKLDDVWQKVAYDPKEWNF